MSFEGLRVNEVEAVKFAFGVFQSEPNKMDAIELGGLMRALNMNPSLARLKELGETTKPGEKYFTQEECMGILVKLKGEVKDMGCYEDFIECLKLYDKNENGRMLSGELSHNLLSLGEKLTDAQVDELFEDCLPEENDDGEIEYVPFLQAMCEKKPEAS